MTLYVTKPVLSQARGKVIPLAAYQTDFWCLTDAKMTMLVSVDPGYDLLKAQGSMFTNGANGKGYKLLKQIVIIVPNIHLYSYISRLSWVSEAAKRNFHQLLHPESNIVPFRPNKDFILSCYFKYFIHLFKLYVYMFWGYGFCHVNVVQYLQKIKSDPLKWICSLSSTVVNIN